MLRYSTIQLLRFHFSFFLLPVYLFALSELPEINWKKALILGAILHLLVYPSSNGYNSYIDRDETPIGGLAQPMQPTKQLFYVSVMMDILAIMLAIWMLDALTAVGILCYILASRAYSGRWLRLKKHAGAGFLIVVVCQGALVFYITQHAAAEASIAPSFLPAVIASFLIGALYPLTQVYQHEADIKDGVTTISYRLGKRGSFVFSAALFLIAALLFFFWFTSQARLNDFYLFLLITFPVVLFFAWWMHAVWNNALKANFLNSLRMNIIATACTTLYFSTLIYIHHFE